MASNEECRMDSGEEEHHSESEGLPSDIGRFLSSSCLESEDRNYPFSAETALSFPGETFKMDPDSILSQSVSDTASVQQAAHCTTRCGSDIGHANVSDVTVGSLLRIPTGSLLFCNLVSTAPSISSVVSQFQSANIMLMAGESGSDQNICKDNITASSTSQPRLEMLRPLQLTTPASPVIIGNSSAVSFVKSVMKDSSSSPAALQSTFTAPTMQTLVLPPGCNILDPGQFAQPAVSQTSADIAQTPLLIHWPASSIPSSSLMASEHVSSDPDVTFTSSQSDAPTISTPVDSNFNSNSSSTNIPQMICTGVSPAQTLTAASQSSFLVSESVDSNSIILQEMSSAVANSVSHTNTMQETAASTSVQSDKKTTVISGSNLNTGSNRAMQQILDYIFSRNQVDSSGSGEGDKDGHMQQTKTHHSTPNVISVNQLNPASDFSAISVPSLGGKSNSIVLIFGKDALKGSTILPASSSVLRTSCSAENSGQPQNPLIFCGNNQHQIPMLGRANSSRDEIDGGISQNQNAGSSGMFENAAPSDVSPGVANIGLSSVPASVMQVASEVNLTSDGTRPSSPCSDNLSPPSPLQLPGSSSTETQQEDNSGQVAAFLQKLVPLTVTEKPTDVSQPVFIFVVLEDGEVKQININSNPSSADSTSKAEKTPSSFTATVQGSSIPSKTTPSASESPPSSPSLILTLEEQSPTTSTQNPAQALEDVAEDVGQQDQVATGRQTRSRSSQPSKRSSASGSKGTKCDLCSATFTRYGNYKRHRKIHTVNLKEDKRFKCPQCDRRFLQHCDMKRHEAVHTKNLPHVCSTCGKGYIRRSDLVVHERFHSKEKAFTCDVCDRSFYQTGDLRRHKRYVHGDGNQQMWPCSHCNRKYAREVTLIQHVKSVHSDILIQITDQMSH